ncbi:DUF3267 domain-containing protein [Mucilaginibacter sp. ZT4R22]|uniref:DUF3267 domain-containing protein n=1 Tax=Mucilaginibacter pankratovii TaxID=2772110 RepID=A0ABR7WP62_9SPHI|nr:DUF3267 domain-containing protein [Mucilaginibacter pankratovii]MBD1364109.1 DUF3267 domain-containing protein [Mucilaginibacter pankratovii]
MQLSPEELPENGYVILDKMDHLELVPFVQAYLKKSTLYSIAYFAANALVVVLMVFYFLLSLHQNKGFSAGKGFSYLAYGIGLAFLLIPLHEYIHVLAYRSQGAKNTSYDANLKKFYFMALADRFVANKREFTIVALAPFVAITLGLLIALLFTGPYWSFTMLGMMFTHTACCSGDFGLLSYFEFNRHKSPVTYDDNTNRVSYFLGKE